MRTARSGGRQGIRPRRGGQHAGARPRYPSCRPGAQRKHRSRAAKGRRRRPPTAARRSVSDALRGRRDPGQRRGSAARDPRGRGGVGRLWRPARSRTVSRMEAPTVSRMGMRAGARMGKNPPLPGRKSGARWRPQPRRRRSSPCGACRTPTLDPSEPCPQPQCTHREWTWGRLISVYRRCAWRHLTVTKTRVARAPDEE